MISYYEYVTKRAREAIQESRDPNPAPPFTILEPIIEGFEALEREMKFRDTVLVALEAKLSDIDVSLACVLADIESEFRGKRE